MTSKQTSEHEALSFASENFAKLFEEYEKDSQQLVEGTVVKGVIVGIFDKGVAIDIGGKSVGFIDIAEFRRDGEIKEGDVTDVFLARIENRKGELVISRENARRYNSWHYLKHCLEDKTAVDGNIIDGVRGNVVVSRRAVLETQRSSERDKVLSGIKVGDNLDGVIKNITDYGAFVDFGSFDGLLHLTDISWCRIKHPSEVLKVGQEIKVQVIKYD